MHTYFTDHEKLILHH